MVVIYEILLQAMGWRFIVSEHRFEPRGIDKSYGQIF